MSLVRSDFRCFDAKARKERKRERNKTKEDKGRAAFLVSFSPFSRFRSFRVFASSICRRAKWPHGWRKEKELWPGNGRVLGASHGSRSLNSEAEEVSHA